MLPNLVGESVLRSPMLALQEHMGVVLQAVEALGDFIALAQDGAWDGALQAQQRVADRESDADHLKQQLRGDMPKSLWMPVARSDLLDLLSAQDKIANRAKDIAGLMLGRCMTIPPALQPEMMAFVQRSVDASCQALKALKELDSLLETGFAGREATLVEKMVEELEEIERETDRMQITVRRALFKLEKELPPVDVMFLYKIIEWIGDVADRAERVGNRLEQLLAR